MPEYLSDRDEDKLIKYVRGIVKCVDQDGMHPTEALEKAARDNKLGPGVIRLLANAYNTGRQVAQQEVNSSTLDKFASFVMADADSVLKKLYPEEVATKKEAQISYSISSDYGAGPEWLNDSDEDIAAFHKAAQDESKSILESIRDRYKKGKQEYFDEFETLRKAAEVQQVNVSAARRKLAADIKDVYDYFLRSPYYRISIGEAEKAASVWYGPTVSKLFDHITSLLPYQEKRASDGVTSTRPLNRNAAPFPAIKACLQDARAFLREKASQQYIETKLAGAEKARSEAVKKAAEEKRAIGPGVLTGYLAANLKPKTRQEAVSSAVDKITDPSHEAELKRIRVHAMLNSLMSDPDDPISQYDPADVLQAYNEIASTIPRGADRSAVVAPLLRRYLQGNTEPFEVKELTEIEKNMAEAARIKK